MKWRMCKCIVRNIGYILSYDFWKQAITDKDFPAKAIFILTIFTCCADSIKMVIVPGYPNNAKE